VWEAITRVDQMRRWFFDNIPAFEPEIGFTTQFEVSSGERVFPHIWTIIAVEPAHKITYNWRYDGYHGNSLVHFELTEDNSKTVLTVTHETTADFPDDIPEFSRESCKGGWEYFIQERLKKYLED
jgi:uncharacterized protein YndB with AHSA1/START domain